MIFDHTYTVISMTGFDFLRLFKDVIGDETGGDATAVGEYAFPTAATVTEMLAEARAFVVDGPLSSADNLQHSWFSTELTSHTFSSYRSDASATGAWDADGSYLEMTHGFGAAIMSWVNAYGVNEANSPAVATWNWLRTFTSNPANEVPPGFSEYQTLNSYLGTYDPTFTIAYAVDFTGRQNLSGFSGQYYEFGWVGLTAELYSTFAPADLKRVKEFLSNLRPRFAGLPISGESLVDDPLRIAYTGLSFQTALDPSWYVDVAAMTGNIYRFTPQGFRDADVRP
jgi:hypothetical protein